MSRLLPTAPRAARVLWVVAALLTLGYSWSCAFGPRGSGTGWFLYVLLLVCAVTCALRAVRERRGRATWALFAVAMLVWCGAEMTYDLWIERLPDVPYPSISDGLWLAYYPLAAAALALGLRERGGSVPRTFWLDLAIGAAAVSAVVVALTIDPVLRDVHEVSAEVAVNAAYPAADLLLVLLIVAAFVLGGSGFSAVWVWLAASFFANIGSDWAYARMTDAGTWVDWSPVGIGWPLAALTIATAAWQPERALGRPRGWSRLLAPALSAALGLGVLVWDHFAHVSVGALALAAAALVLVIVRFALVFRENVALIALKHEEAMTDPLTGLGNRRALMSDLRAAATGGRPTVLALYDLDGFKRYNDRFGHPAGDELLHRLGARLGDLARLGGGRGYRLGGDEFCLLAPLARADATVVAEAGRRALAEHGEGFEISASMGQQTLPCSGGAEEALRLADRRMYAAKYSGLRAGARQAVDALLAAVRERHPDLGDHNDGVADLAVTAAAQLDVPPEQIELVRLAAELHDVGKIAIPDSILSKPGPLTAEEWRFMHRHTLIGERILLAAPDLQAVAPIVRASHERWDGGGYPDGVAGLDIPLAARIITACDAYDAMVSERPYSPARPPEEALAELHRCAGSQFDPAVVAAVSAVLDPVRGTTLLRCT